MKIFKLTTIALLAGLAFNASAQKKVRQDTAIKSSDKAIFFNAGLQYISNLTYAGRKDESSVPIVFPTFTVISKYGLFLNAIDYFDVNGPKSGAEGLSITPGYVFSFDDKKEFGGAISATKYFITNKSPIILSSFNATIDGQLSYTGIFKFTISGTYSIDKDNKRDIINNAQLEKDIWLYKTGVLKSNGLKITPTATLYSGTQLFTETYYTNSQVPRAVADPAILSPINLLFPNLPTQSIVNQTVTEEKQREVKKYQLLALSGSLPITYTLNNWQFSVTPYLTQPFNQVNYVNSNTNGSYFFFNAGASLTF
jgi:hypothetical protein